jgi:DNA polymerase V
MGKMLIDLGVTPALGLRQQSDTWLTKHFNVVGQRTAKELRGTPCIPLELAPPPRKGLMASRSFGRPITQFEPMREALASYVTRAAEKLRSERRHARYMMIFMHNSPFDPREPYFSRQVSFQLAHPTSDTAELIHQACQAMARIFRPGVRYNRCGVMLTELTPDSEHQGDFLDTRDRARSKQLMTALDAINRRMGKGTLFYAASGVRREWVMSRSLKSPHFTTDWQQLLQIRAR